MRALVLRPSPVRRLATRLAGTVWAHAYFSPLSPLALVELPEPRLPGPDWVTVRTRLCGISESDGRRVFLKNAGEAGMLAALASSAQVLGHEVVGTVEAVGGAAGPRRRGERVVLDPVLSCAPRGIAPPCEACAAGNHSLCRNFDRGRLRAGLRTGACADAPGGFGELLPAHASQCIPVPEGVSDEEAVLASPFSVCLHAILRNPPRGPTALVYGCGALGLLSVAILRALHPEVRCLAVCRHPHEGALAKRLGASRTIAARPLADIVERVAAETGSDPLYPRHGLPWLHGGVEAVYDTVGSAESLDMALRVTAPRGRITVIGAELRARLDWGAAGFKEIALGASSGFGVEELAGERRRAIEIYLDMVRERRIDLSGIVTHRFPIDRYRDAFIAWRRKGRSQALKIAIQW